MDKRTQSLSEKFASLTAPELRRLLTEYMSEKKLGISWEHDAIARDRALNADIVLPRISPELSCRSPGFAGAYENLVIEGDNFDALRLLRSTHANSVRVIYIDPPYNTGNKDWVYNDRFVGKKDRWRHSQWLEFLYQRLTLARDLLTPDGVILVSINDENRARLDMLMEEVFPGMRKGSFVWKTRSGSNDESGAQFSVDHEHVLVYAGEGFRFQGKIKDLSQYKNPDNDPRGRWKTGDLSKSHTRLVRENAYYPIQNPKTGVWYPCNPSRVWAFASEAKLEPGEADKLRAETMEEYIRQGKVIFPDADAERVVIWETKEQLLDAIRKGDVPLRPKSRTPLLTEDLPDLDFWVGRKVGFGRPWFKRHLKDLQSEIRPVSSWIRGATEEPELDEFTVGLVAQRSGTGEHSVNEILGFNAFEFPKPPSLLRSLLLQATGPNDIVLDFFAGSGTTGQAVLALNKEDGGRRKFILCSNTEANELDPGRNVCRDVCAKRLKKVIEGYSDQPPLGGNFAYIQLEKLHPADAPFDFAEDQAFQLLSMRTARVAAEYKPALVSVIARGPDFGAVFIPHLSDEALAALLQLTDQRLAIYSNRPQTLAEQLSASGKVGHCYSIVDAVMFRQAGANV